MPITLPMSDEEWMKIKIHSYHSFNPATGKAHDGTYCHDATIASKMKMSEVELRVEKKGIKTYTTKLYYDGCLEWLHQLIAYWNKSDYVYSIIPA